MCLLQVAANGDTANKIGTYQIAVLAKFHNVPFYVAAPFTSIDAKIPSGDHIVIEERPDREMTHIGEHRIAAKGLNKPYVKITAINATYTIRESYHKFTFGICNVYK